MRSESSSITVSAILAICFGLSVLAATPQKEKEFTFEGEVSVDFEVTRKTSNLSFHASHLEFSSVTVECAEVLPSTDAMFDVDSTGVTVLLARDLEAGSQCSIKFYYNGTMRDFGNGGLVREPVSLGEGTQKWIVYTGYKLSTAMPRTLFPCIDEPAYKAKFSLSLLHPSGLVAIASTLPKEATEAKYGWMYSAFEKTDKIPTFGVSFTVGEFRKIASKITPKRTIDTWIPYDIADGIFVDNNAIAAYIEQLESYLDVDYPSSKLDVVGLPRYENSDFVCSSIRTPTSGIVFIEHESVTSLEKVGIAIGRGWFGVLLSPRRWEDGFLVEGFATYFYIPGDHFSLYDELDDMRQLFFARNLLFDLQWSSAPVTKNTIIKSEPSCFTREMGVKSALILQMVQRIVGEENFRHSVQKFLKSHLNAAVTHDDLYQLFTESMEEAGSKDWCGRPLNADTFLTPWLTQLGYPSVLVYSEADGQSIILSQQSSLQQYNQSTWPVPIFLDSQSLRWIPPGNAQCAVSSSLILNGTERELLRPSSLLYSVFVYDDYERSRIINLLSPNLVQGLTESDRLALLIHHLYCDWNFCSEMFAINKTDAVKVVTKVTETTRSIAILDTVKETFTKLRSLFLDTPYSNLFKEFGKSLFGRNFGRAPLKINMNSLPVSLMEAVLGYAIEFDVSDVRRQSFELFKTAYEQCTSSATSECEKLPLDPALISDILCGAVKFDPSYAFTRLLEHTRKLGMLFPNSLQQQESLYQGLSCVENEGMLREYISEVVQILADPYKLSQLGYDPFHLLKNSYLASDVMASYLAEHALEIVDMNALGTYGNVMVESWNSPERLDQLKQMEMTIKGLTSNNDTLDELDFAFSFMEGIVENNVNERNLHLEPLASYFRQYVLDAK